jgi:hypothetical protein
MMKHHGHYTACLPARFVVLRYYYRAPANALMLKAALFVGLLQVYYA